MAIVTESAASGGRPLDAARERAILDAALSLLAEVGYDRMSIDSIARRARASKATIYRRWAGKAELVAAALRLRVDKGAWLPDTGTLRGDLLEGLTRFCEGVAREDADLLIGLISAMRADPALARLVRSQMIEEKRQGAEQMLSRAFQRGELPCTVDTTFLVEVACAVVYQRFLLIDEPLDVTFVERVVDRVLLPLLRE
ncbi:MAG: transcriptional regulator, TetR family [Chloroflexi bacterium]|jgi:AcrR family transcriptional regulator|nr:transcriptional regulator, TetR family [Chloroflexota bacterium]